jgi:hypothetical protein
MTFGGGGLRLGGACPASTRTTPAWPAGAAELRSKAWPLLIEAAILLGLMLTGTWLVRP